MLHLDPRDALARYFVYAVAASSLIMVWQVGIKFKFRYASTRDVGISVYLLLVVVFFYNLIPLEIIKPVFFADPLVALTFGTFAQKLLLSVLVALAEGLSCDYDNLF